MLLFWAAPWVNAKTLSEATPGLISNLISRLPLNGFQFDFAPDTQNARTFFAACMDKNGRQGLIPYNVPTPLCWTFDESAGAIKSTSEYENVFETEVDFNNAISVFLENQLVPHKGIWTSWENTVCYSQENKNYCLKKVDVGISSMGTTEKPVTEEPGNNFFNNSIYTIAFFSVTVFVMTAAVIGFMEMYLHCILRCNDSKMAQKAL
jgi:hypothetical protein